MYVLKGHHRKEKIAVLWLLLKHPKTVSDVWRGLFPSLKKRAWPWMDPIVEETSPSQHFLHGIWVGGKGLIAIYLPNAAFDTHDEPASFDCHLLRRQGFFSPHFAQHRLLRLCISGLHFFFFAQTVHFEGIPTQLRHLSSVIVERSTEPPTRPHPQREAGIRLLWRGFLKQKGFPDGLLVCLALFCFPTTWCRIRRWMNICVY